MGDTIANATSRSCEPDRDNKCSKPTAQIPCKMNTQMSAHDEGLKLCIVLDTIAMPAFILNAHGKIILWNRACEMLTGMLRDDMIGTERHREVFHGDHRPVLADLVLGHTDLDGLRQRYGPNAKKSRMLKNGYEGQGFFPNLGSEGKWLAFEAAPLKDARGRISGAIETLRDITNERIDKQKQVRDKTQYGKFFDSANDAIFLLKDGLCIDCNPKALDLFECSLIEILNRTPQDFSPKRQPGGELSEVAINKKLAIKDDSLEDFFEWRFVRTNGSHFDAEVSIKRFILANERYTLAILRDISKRKALIQSLEDRQKELDEKTRYLEKVNQALKNALDHREIEKRAIEEDIYIKLKRFISPYIEELNKCRISPDARSYLNILESNLNEVMTRFHNTIFSIYMPLTPTEIRIADFIRDGKDSKQIARIMRLSPSSIQWHRKNIRGKLKLTNKKVNMHTYLNSLKI